MKKHKVSSGWYGDCTLEGDYVSLIRDKYVIRGNYLNNFEEIISLPEGENVLQLVCMRFNGQVLIAGQSSKFGNWLYKDNVWQRVTQTSFGTFACAFGSGSLYCVINNNLYCIYNLNKDKLSEPINRIIGSQGIRYINISQSYDGIVTGDSTYGPKPYNLSQWSRNDDLVIGQSYINGAIGQYNNVNYLIESGDTQFLRLHKYGNNFCLPIVKMQENVTVFYWMTIDELKTLPIQDDTKNPIHIPVPPVNPPITPPTKPSNPIPPTEGKKMKNKDQVRSDINELIRFYNEPDGLNRKARGIESPVVFNDPAITDWFTLAVMEDIETIKNRIRQYDEYKNQHVGEAKPNPQ